MKTRKGYLTYSKAGYQKPIMYISPDGTPGRAIEWWLNPPYEIVKQASKAEMPEMEAE